MLHIELYRLPRLFSACSCCLVKSECKMPIKKRHYVKYCSYELIKYFHPDFELPFRDSEGNIIEE